MGASCCCSHTSCCGPHTRYLEASSGTRLPEVPGPLGRRHRGPPRFCASPAIGPPARRAAAAGTRFNATRSPQESGSGVYHVKAKENPMYTFRETISLGSTTLDHAQVRASEACAFAIASAQV